MPMQGNSATIRHEHVARRRPPRALSVSQDEPVWMGYLLVVFMITLFIPKSVALNLGSVALTPTLASALILFPALAFNGRIKYAWPDLFIVFFMVSTLISTLDTAPLAVCIEAFGRRVLTGGVPYLVGRYLGSRPNVFNPFMRRLMAVMAFMAIFLVLESWFRLNIHSVLWSEPYDPHPKPRHGLTRAYGWTSHSIMLGISYGVFVPVMMVAAIERMNQLGGRLRWLKLGLLMLGVFCSLSTGAWLPAIMAVGLVVYDYLKFMTPGNRWLLLSISSSSMYLFLEVLSGRPLLRIMMMKLHLTSEMAWWYRWQLYKRVYALMPGYEWFGHGLKTPAGLGWQWSIDNNFLVVLMLYGRVGLTLWIAMPVAVLVYGWKSIWNVPDSSYRRVARAVMFAIVAVALTQLSVAMFSTAEMLNYMFMGLGIGLAQGLAASGQAKRPRRKPQPRRPRHDAPAQPSPALSEPAALRPASDV
ncbi:MAG: hypothetical protein KTR15_13970 [Phycisphaeraceae bacterium]|nr:hypothetical protein [Phycisphaeraceae bacterium]